eukprot:gene6644-7955_t
MSGPKYKYNLKYYFGVLDTCFPEHKRYEEGGGKGKLTEENYKQVLNCLRHEAGMNGVRMPIFCHGVKPEEYTDFYKEVYRYLREDLKMYIYATGLTLGHNMGREYRFSEEGSWLEDSESFAAWYAEYINYFEPDFLSPFKESGCSFEKQAEVVEFIKAKVKPGCKTKILGPDTQHVKQVVKHVEKNGAKYHELYDIITTHSADSDFTATAENHRAAVEYAASHGKACWNTENPSFWLPGKQPAQGKEREDGEGLPGIKVVSKDWSSGILLDISKTVLSLIMKEF